jgi:hypothetical protein
MDLLEINVPRLRLGIAALRSRLYRKGTGYLHRTAEDTWCCLGVFTDVAIKLGGLDLSREIIPAGHLDPEHERFGGIDTQNLVLAVAEWLGFGYQMDPGVPLSPEDAEQKGQDTLYATTMNDHGLVYAAGASPDFSDVADAFERLADQAEAAQKAAAGES